MTPFDNPSHGKEKITGKHVAIILGLAIVIMAPLGWMVYQQRVEAAAKVEAARVAQIQKEQANKAVAAMMVNLPQKPKGKKKMVKIVRGTTGPIADDGLYPPSTGFDGHWYILENGAGPGNEMGWGGLPFPNVQVPLSAAPGIYTMEWHAEPAEPGGGDFEAVPIQFEVVCVKINLSATKVRGVGSGSGSGSG